MKSSFSVVALGVELLELDGEVVLGVGLVDGDQDAIADVDAEVGGIAGEGTHERELVGVTTTTSWGGIGGVGLVVTAARGDDERQTEDESCSAYGPSVPHERLPPLAQ